MKEESPDPQVSRASSAEDLRIGDLLGKDLKRRSRPRVAILGMPSDDGVRRNGGRPGACFGPSAIRRWLYRFTVGPEGQGPFPELVRQTRDLGNLELAGDLSRNQQELGKRVSELLAGGVVPIILGGGHETSFGHFLGYVDVDRDVEILNWDAHPDVRPLKKGKPHSGSPFRQAILHKSGRCRRYTVAGLLPHSVASAHLEFLDQQGCQRLWSASLSPERVEALYDSMKGPCLVTFDLDAVDQAYAPGVSAPACAGLNPSTWLHAAHLAGRSACISSFDIVELNPLFDHDNQTARLAALTVWHFLKGLSERESED